MYVWGYIVYRAVKYVKSGVHIHNVLSTSTTIFIHSFIRKNKNNIHMAELGSCRYDDRCLMLSYRAVLCCRRRHRHYRRRCQHRTRVCKIYTQILIIIKQNRLASARNGYTVWRNHTVRRTYHTLLCVYVNARTAHRVQTLRRTQKHHEWDNDNHKSFRTNPNESRTAEIVQLAPKWIPSHHKSQLLFFSSSRIYMRFTHTPAQL